MKAVSRPSIIDVEATGLGTGSYPIEIGMALATGVRYSTLIAPARNWTYWDREAESIHLLPRSVILTHGRPVQEVALKLNELLGTDTVFSDGWVVDKPWIIKLFDAAGIRQTFSVSPIEIILTEAQMAIWHETRSRLEEKNRLSRHRASMDALVIQETFVETRRLTATETNQP